MTPDERETAARTKLNALERHYLDLRTRGIVATEAAMQELAQVRADWRVSVGERKKSEEPGR